MKKDGLAKKDMKIAWLHSHFLYSVGATRYIFEVSRRLAKKHDLTLFVEKSSDFWKKKFIKEGIEVKKISSLSSNSPIYWLFFPFFACRELRILKREANKFDFIISSIFPMNWISLYLGKPTLFLCFEPFSFFYNKELISKLVPLKRIFVKLLAMLYSRYDFLGTHGTKKLLTLNEARTSLIHKIYGKKPDGITGIAVDSDFFMPTENKSLQRKYRGQKIILHSTDFTAPKGSHFLIKALPEIVRVIPKTKLFIISAVENVTEKERLKDLAKDSMIEKNLEFIGYVEEKLLPAYYTLADVTAFVADPKNTVSSSSLIVLESLACQTPVVCSMGQLEGMVDDKTGYFVDPRDTKELADKIIKILSNKKLRQKMGEEGRRSILGAYSWNKVVREFEKQIRMVAVKKNL